MNLKNVKKLHFIGIGGSGMFPLAAILKQKGYEITGSDSYDSDTVEKIRKLDIKVAIGQCPENIKNPDLVIFSAAINKQNPEFLAAKEKNIQMLERSEMLGILEREYYSSVGISGTHGKTTTTALVTHVLIEAKKDPTAMIGANVPKIGGNSCFGKSDIFICEACEYVNSFLELNPKISVILNVDNDHLDYFKNIENTKNSFKKFAEKTRETVIVNGDDENSRDSVNGLNKELIFYGINENNDYAAKNIVLEGTQYPNFDIFKSDKKIIHIEMNIPGKHNVYNALAAYIVCEKLGVSAEDFARFAKTFKGASRRFEILGEANGITVADDYAHHPTELEATLKAAKNMNFKRVIAIFQPHTFSRTKIFLNEFAEALKIADIAVIYEIWPARETNTYNIFSEDLAERTSGSICLKTFEEIYKFIEKNAQKGDLILTVGAGNINKCGEEIAKMLEKP